MSLSGKRDAVSEGAWIIRRNSGGVLAGIEPGTALRCRQSCRALDFRNQF